MTRSTGPAGWRGEGEKKKEKKERKDDISTQAAIGDLAGWTSCPSAFYPCAYFCPPYAAAKGGKRKKKKRERRSERELVSLASDGGLRQFEVFVLCCFCSSWSSSKGKKKNHQTVGRGRFAPASHWPRGGPRLEKGKEKEKKKKKRRARERSPGFRFAGVRRAVLLLGPNGASHTLLRIIAGQRRREKREERGRALPEIILLLGELETLFSVSSGRSRGEKGGKREGRKPEGTCRPAKAALALARVLLAYRPTGCSPTGRKKKKKRKKKKQMAGGALGTPCRLVLSTALEFGLAAEGKRERGKKRGGQGGRTQDSSGGGNRFCRSASGPSQSAHLIARARRGGKKKKEKEKWRKDRGAGRTGAASRSLS